MYHGQRRRTRSRLRGQHRPLANHGKGAGVASSHQRHNTRLRLHRVASRHGGYGGHGKGGHHTHWVAILVQFLSDGHSKRTPLH